MSRNPQGQFKPGHVGAGRRELTPAETQRLTELYPHHTSQRVATLMGLSSCSQVNGFAQRLGLSKSPEHLKLVQQIQGPLLAERTVPTRFKRGLIPWNKGKKGLYCGSDVSKFKPGQAPHNTVSVGTVVPNSDGILKMKIAEPNVWQYVHRLNWEDAHGPIPAKHAVIFRDRNTGNPALENLELVSRTELMARNTLHRYPAPVVNLIRLKARLQRKLNQRETQ